MSRRITLFSLVSFASISLANSGCELVNKFEGWTPPEGSAAGRGNVAGNAGVQGKIAPANSAGNLGTVASVGSLGSAGSVGAISPVGTVMNSNASGAPAIDGSGGGIVAGNANAVLVNPPLGGSPNVIGASGAAGVLITSIPIVGLGGAVTAGQGGQQLDVGGDTSNAGRSSSVFVTSGGSDGGTGPRNAGGSVAQVGGVMASGGAVSGGTTGSGGTTAVGGAASGGTTGTTSSCSNEGCACTGTATIACNDCGTRACNQTTHQWGACTATQSPAATQCANSTTLQTCGSDGRWVSSTCPNADATHCSGTCVTGASNASCVVAALDSDNDGHKSRLCTAAPGDDCDDGNRNVYPGAIEVCDGVDNDCNGKADLKDGLVLSGNPKLHNYIRMSLAWSPTLQRFAAVAAEATERGIYFGSLQPNTGAATFNNSPTLTYDGDLGSLQVLWIPMQGAFAVAYNRGGLGGTGGYVHKMSDQGVSSNSYSIGGGVISLALRASGDVLVAHSNEIGLYSGSQPQVVSTINGETPDVPRVAASGDSGAVVYIDYGDSNVVKWARISAAASVGVPVQLASSGGVPEIAAVANGYAIAWPTAAGFDFQIRNNSDGSIVCGPTHVSIGDGVSDDRDRVVLSATQHGTLALTTNYDSGQIHLVRLDDSCNIADSLILDNTSTMPNAPAIATGGGYVALAWHECPSGITCTSDSPDSHITSRVMGERLCN